MAPQDSRATFLRIPWAATLLKQPNTICRVPNSRESKASGEDTLFAETLKQPRTLRSCLVFYQKPPADKEWVEDVSVLFTLGNGMNGHPNVLHGGIVAALLDEAMGMLQGCNHEWRHMSALAKGKAEGELPPQPNASYTATFQINYLKPVQTPGALIVSTRYLKRDGRKTWVYAEIKQRENIGEDYDGDEVVCATGEALFIEPKPKKSKL